MTAPFEVDILATPEAISGLTEKILAFLEEQQVDARATHHVALVVEELVTNLGMHGNCLDKPATVRITVELTQVNGEIVDTGPPFDPAKAPTPDINAPISERPIGGLGLHLVREFTKSFEYLHRDDKNFTRFSIARAL
jgi:serine/threonine-protein kinase RsbW/sigma-B regulation protein RsbU (phosphoserine phosphatase)